MGNEVKSEPHLTLVIVLLILSASAIAMLPSKYMLLFSKLQNEGVTKLNDQNAVIDGQQMRRGGNAGRRASLDSSDRLVDLKRLGDRDSERITYLGAMVARQAANEGWEQNWNDQNDVTDTIT
jgi:hypothetical protein